MPLGPRFGSALPHRKQHRGSTSPAPPSPSSTLGSRQAKNERSHVEWVSETRSTTAVLPRGPPHIGKRDELLKENKALFKKHEDAVSELREAERKIARLHTSAPPMRLSLPRAECLEEKVAPRCEVEKVRTAAAAGQRLLQLGQSVPRRAAGVQWPSRQDSRGLGPHGRQGAAARAIRGPLQIDLDGTLSTLEDAAAPRAAVAGERGGGVRRETDLTQQLHESESQRLSPSGSSRRLGRPRSPRKRLRV